MQETQKKKTGTWQECFALALYLLLGAACGILIGRYLKFSVFYGGGIKAFWEVCLTLVLLYASMAAAVFLQIVLHEAGHLVFGLLSGYRFSSFRIGSFMWRKENGRLRFCRLSLAGTGGQCLMAPPDMADGSFSVMLYNLGGSLLNLLSAFCFLGISVLTDSRSFAVMLLQMLSVIGLAFALANGIPLRLKMVDNDGYNAFSLGKDPDARYSFWVQLKVNEQTTKGIRLKDMPEEWFAIPSDRAMQNSMVAARGVFACNRLMDAHRFDEADALMTHFLEIDTAVIGLHRSLLACDRIYCEMVQENRPEVLGQILTKNQKKFMKAMRKFPSVLRTEYVYALLAQKDATKAQNLLKQFEKTAKQYPYPSEIESERELMQIAEKQQEKDNPLC